jgi:transmembrane sensor
MSTPASGTDSRVQRMEAAAQWLQRLRAEGTDERIVEEWLEWCQRDPLNQQAFDEMAAVWELTGRLDEARNGAAQDVRAPHHARQSRGRRMALAASLAGLVIAGGAGWWWSAQTRDAAGVAREYSSPVGVNSMHELADGSRLELGGGTRVTVAMAANERRVTLHEGELFVTVRSNSARPFLVDTGRLEVVATGTAFNVLRTVRRTTVTVAEGSVEARYEDAASPIVQLPQDQQLVYSHEAHSVEVRQAASADATAWRTGRLVCKQEPLTEIISTLNRYTTRTIIIEDARVAGWTFSGTVHIHDIDGSLEAMRVSLPVEIRELAGGRRLIASRPERRTD